MAGLSLSSPSRSTSGKAFQLGGGGEYVTKNPNYTPGSGQNPYIMVNHPDTKTPRVGTPGPTGSGGVPLDLSGLMSGLGGGGGGGSAPVPFTGKNAPTFKADSTPYMKEVMQMYRDLIGKNEALSGQYNVDDIINKQRAENSLAMNEAEAAAGKSGGMSSAEKRNMLMDQARNIAETRGTAGREKLDFERGLLQDLAGAVGGASGLAGTEGSFLNAAQGQQQDLWKSINLDYPLELAKTKAETANQQIAALSALANLGSLV